MRRLLVGAFCLLLAGCGGSGAGSALYVLGSTPASANASVVQTTFPVLEVKPVQFPSYLDTTDLVVRGPGGRLYPSAAGRWGERLSEGFTRALAADLAGLLPRMAVMTEPPVERPAAQVLVDVETFEATTDGSVGLIARWTVTDGAARQVVASERAVLSVRMQGTGDPAVVNAMTQAVQDLAGRIAARVARFAPSRRR
jgi:uncharacterized lipoprotein YmbA